MLAFFGLVLVVILSGCAGKSDSAAGPKATTVVGNDGLKTGLNDLNCPGCAPAETGKLDPKRHLHHYWGDRKEVTVFDGPLTFRPDILPRLLGAKPPEATSQDLLSNVNEGCISVGYRQWDLEDDGDDVGGDQINPINPDTNRADTVFAGSYQLRVELISNDSTIQGIGFKWKPANLNFFTPEAGCGAALVKGQPMFVNVSRGQADPPHQFFSSRWEFKAYSIHRVAAGDQDDPADVPSIAQGSFRIKITAENGGEASLDPAHPDLYAAGPVYDLGCTQEVAVERQLVADPLMPARGQLTGIKWSDGRIVPLQTGKVLVTLKVEYKGAVAGTVTELWYHGSNTTKYSNAGPGTGAGDEKTYEIPDPQQILADPPYEYKTLWGFELRPKGPSGAPTEFTGTYELCAQAHRDPTAPTLS